MANWKRICCPVDFSRQSRTAMKEAAELARRLEGELTLVHVDDRTPRAGDSAERREQGRIELERKLAAWRDEARAIATTPVDHVLLAGDPASEIARLAGEGGYDAVVVGAHGQSGRDGGPPGSVAQRVVREAPCTVTLVRGRAASAGEGPPPR